MATFSLFQKISKKSWYCTHIGGYDASQRGNGGQLGTNHVRGMEIFCFFGFFVPSAGKKEKREKDGEIGPEDWAPSRDGEKKKVFRNTSSLRNVILRTSGRDGRRGSFSV